MGLKLRPGSDELNKIVDRARHDNDNNKSAKQAISAMKNSSIFDGEGVDCYFDRMANAAEKLKNNDSWRISMDTNGDGVVEQGEELALADAIAASFDSELDLYIQEKVNEAMRKFGSCSKGYLGEKAQKWLKDNYNIVVEAVGSEEKQTNRAYAFSLVDENGNVIQDANGKKGSYIFADCLIPDGYAQGAEVNLSSILDQMGYECISKADFIGHENEYYELISAVEENLQSGLYSASDGGTEKLYGNRKDITLAVQHLWGGRGSAPGTGGASGELTADEEMELKEKEGKETETKKEEYKKELIEKAIEKYKEENGEEPIGIDLAKIENEAQLKANAKYAS